MINRAAPLRPVTVQPGQLFSQPPPAPPHNPIWQPAQLLRHLRELEDNLLLLKAVKEEVGVVFSLGVASESTDALPQTSLFPSEECPSGLADSSTKPSCPNRRKQCVVDSEHPPAEDGAFKDSKDPSDPTCLPSDDDSTYQREIPKNFKSLELLRTAVATAADLGTQSIGLDARKLAAVHAARSLSRHVTYLLSPFGQQPSSTGGGVDKPAVIALLEKKRLKLKRNRKWRSKRRRHAAIALEKGKAEFEKIDALADAWRAREIANDLSKRKMEHMRVIAEQKAKEDKLRRAQEQEMVLLVEKLHELRSLRIQKLKKQGKFFPDEDNEFLERIRLAVEEEERQAAVAADTSAAATAIANASVAAESASSGKTIAEVQRPGAAEVMSEEKERLPEPDSNKGPAAGSCVTAQMGPVKPVPREISDGFQNRGLPPEFYHYYYGSSFDMGALIEVRRSWDAFIVPAGGSRIPGHWVQAPRPADAVWASYLVNAPP